MSINLNQNPYFDDYSAAKKFVQILAVPDRAIQAREITQIQSMFLDFMKRIGDLLFKDGSIVDGCNLVIKDTSAIISPGSIYFGGLVHHVPEATLTITGTGEEYIGVKLVEDIIDEVEDESLRDPALGIGDNYREAGAHRLRRVLVYSVGDPTAIKLFTIQDGLQTSETVTPEFNTIVDLLARRTFDESGNYKVYGYTMYTEAYDSTNIRLVVDSGKAYVKGYEISKIAPTKLIIPKAQAYRSVNGETKTYSTGVSDYTMNSDYGKQITEVLGVVEVTEAIVHNATRDELPHKPVSSVVGVYHDSECTNPYTLTTDYTVDGNYIDWSPGGAEPSAGGTYYVKWRYSHTFAIGTEVSMVLGENNETIVRFLTGTRPVDGQVFYADYDYYLARKDTITMNKDGEIQAIYGQSDDPAYVVAPVVTSDSLLVLGTVYLPPNGAANICQVTYQKGTRMTMSELQKLSAYVDDIAYNQAVDELDRDAQSGESPSNLKGVFSDGFLSLQKADLAHADFGVLYDLDNNWLELVPDETYRDFSADPTNNSFTVQKNTYTISNPYTESATISQLNATGSMLINPYAMYAKECMLALTPAFDNAVTNIVIEKTAAKTVYKHGGTHKKNKVLSTTEKTSASIIAEEVSQYMRQVTLEVAGKNFVPGADNLACTFDDVAVTLTPTGSTQAGTNAGTVKANASGEFTATFTIPANEPVGTRGVKVSNTNNEGQTTYTASGITVTTEITTTTITVRESDPLAESFTMQSDGYVTGVGLFFTAKDGVETNNVIVELHNMSNGLPGTKVYARKLIPGSTIVADDLGQVETKVTFDDPVFCSASEQYCFVVLTDSDSYEIAIAELGKPDMVSGLNVSSNPYTGGIMFSSSNALSWATHNASDLKFKLYTAQFTETAGECYFDTWSCPAGLFDRVELSTVSDAPVGTRLEWEMQLNASTDWVSITPDVLKELSAQATAVKIRAKFYGTSNLSPLLAIGGINMTGFKSHASGSYISRNTILAQAYTTVKVVMDTKENAGSGSTVTPRFDTNNDDSWETMTLVSSVQSSEDGWVTKTYQTDGLGANLVNFRVRLDLAATNPLVRPIVRKLRCIVK